MLKGTKTFYIHDASTPLMLEVCRYKADAVDFVEGTAVARFTLQAPGRPVVAYHHLPPNHTITTDED